MILQVISLIHILQRLKDKFNNRYRLIYRMKGCTMSIVKQYRLYSLWTKTNYVEANIGFHIFSLIN